MTNNTIPHDHQPQLQQEQSPVVVMKPQVKKQARRRTHASRPYQERLLNMAEARREIVTALKIHRATMRQQPCTYQHQEPPPLLRQPPLEMRQQEHQQQQQGRVVFQDRSQAVEEEAPLHLAPMSYAASFADHQLRNPLGKWVAAAAPAGSYYYPSPVRPYDLTPLEAPTAMGGLDQLARSLPAQPLGLNLSFQGFGGSVDGAKDCEDLFGVPSIRSSPPVASSYSPPATETASGTYGSPALSTAEKYPPSAVAPAALIAPVLDDMETQPAGEMQQGVEWWGEATDADVAAASAWWSKILLESMEGGGGEVAEGGAPGCAADNVATAAAAAGLPAEWRWLCEAGVGEQGVVTGADDKPPDVLETMHADGDYSTCCYKEGRRSDDGGDGIALPCMDDIEGWDGEWFSCSS
ncbi:hypothetical protein C2845_PM03G12810 [Panicum miliaceum]|uniref:Uncharacterized protein n=1 Tax=Panicum miliaceum TaxID=4540 RepID=A0A3L6T9T4_PANMI|nr:hypothetical protein C2845_PM03G12810 [Panicum miliaceum]